MQSASDTPSSHSSQGRAQPDRAPRAHVVAQRVPERGEPGPKQVVAKERVRPAAGAPGRIHERHATLRPEDRDIESEPLMENLLVVIAPASHDLAGRRDIPFALLAGERFLVREHGSGTRIMLESLFRERGTTLKIRMELGSNEAIKQAVAGGLGLALLSRSTLSADGGSKELVVLDVQGFPIQRFWYLVRPKGKPLSVVADTFLQFLRAHIALLRRDR